MITQECHNQIMTSSSSYKHRTRHKKWKKIFDESVRTFHAKCFVENIILCNERRRLPTSRRTSFWTNFGI